MRAFILAVTMAVLASTPATAQGYSLDVPAEAHIRQALEIGWTAPQPDGGRIEIRPEGSNARASYAYTNSNPKVVIAPAAPGDYVVVYIYENEVQASQPLVVFLPEASVTVPASAAAGENFEVGFSGPMSQNDRVMFAMRDGEFIRGSSYSYVGTAQEGTTTLRAPNDAGEYDVIYISGETILARAPISVDAISATLTVPIEIQAGGLVSVGWDGPLNVGDRVTFAERDGEVVPGASYHYVSHSPDGSTMLAATEVLGAYDVVYVSGGRIIGRSPIEIVEASVAIEAPVEVVARMEFQTDWSGAGNQGDQIVMASATNDRAAYRYVDPSEGFVRMAAPEETGSYELIYFTRADREMTRRPITVIPAPEEPGTLYVEQVRAALGQEDAVEIILDASGSMLQRIGGQRRIEIARETLSSLIADTIPANTGFVLRVFGHMEADSCRTDLEIPLGPLNPGAAGSTISNINAMNLARTPIADSIARVPNDLAGVDGERVLIVLTDGEETCDGDPAVAIQSLRNQGWDIRVNIVGFAIDDAELRETFQSWAAAGGGEYFNATDADELGEAMTRAVATRFEVVDADGNIAATGLTGGEGIVLPPGGYTVRYGDAGERPVTMVSDDALTITLE